MIASLLALMREHPGLTIQQAADRLGVRTSDVHNALAHLRGLGLVDGGQPEGGQTGSGRARGDAAAAGGPTPGCGTPAGCGELTGAADVAAACARCPLVDAGCMGPGAGVARYRLRLDVIGSGGGVR